MVKALELDVVMAHVSLMVNQAVIVVKAVGKDVDEDEDVHKDLL